MGVDVSMELRTEKVYTEEKKGPATTQLTFDETYHLPDYLPDRMNGISVVWREKFHFMR